MSKWIGRVMQYHKYMRIAAKVQRLATICLDLTLQTENNEKHVLKRFMTIGNTNLSNQLPEEE